MGVQGLLKRLNKDFDENSLSREIIPRNSTLIVDGNGLLFHMMTSVVADLHGLTLDKQYGGNYTNFEELTRKEIFRMTKILGFNLVVYFDGDDSYLKGDTSAKRRKRMNEEWVALYYSTLGDTPTLQDNLPLPCFAKDQLVFTLKNLKVPIVYCQLEADQDIALA